MNTASHHQDVRQLCNMWHFRKWLVLSKRQLFRHCIKSFTYYKLENTRTFRLRQLPSTNDWWLFQRPVQAVHHGSRYTGIVYMSLIGNGLLMPSGRISYHCTIQQSSHKDVASIDGIDAINNIPRWQTWYLHWRQSLHLPCRENAPQAWATCHLWKSQAFSCMDDNVNGRMVDLDLT